MGPLHRPIAGYKTLAETRIAENEPEDLLTLLEDFISMSDEQQSLESCRAEPLVIESRNPSLSSARRGNHEIAEVSPLAFGGNCFKHFKLKRLGRYVNGESKRRRHCTRMILGIQRRLQSLAVDPWVIRLELGLIPILFEGRTDPIDDCWIVD